MSDRPAGVWSFLNSAAALWTVAATVVGTLISLVSAYYGLANRLSAVEVTQGQLVSQVSQGQAVSQDLGSKVQTLEDNRANDESNFNSQIQGLQTQVQSLQTEERDIGAQLSSIGQSVAAISAQMSIVINRTLPGPADGQTK